MTILIHAHFPKATPHGNLVINPKPVEMTRVDEIRALENETDYYMYPDGVLVLGPCDRPRMITIWQGFESP